jgi:hypothetical protein
VAVLTHSARRRLQHPLLTFLLSLVIATALGVIVYVVTSTLPYFSASPTTDPNFGAIDQCLMRQLPRERQGFAVDADGHAAASFDGEKLIICRENADPLHPNVEQYTLSGIVHAAFDFSGRLWLSRRTTPDSSELWLLDGGHARHVGNSKPLALVGTLFGVVVLEPQGHVISLSPDEAVLGVTDLEHFAAPANLTASADGERVAIAAVGGFWVLDAQRLARLRAEAPCAVDYLWWRKSGHQVLLTCEPDYALVIDADTGGRDEAPRLKRTPSVLVPKRGIYAQECEGLPCTASSP